MANMSLHGGHSAGGHFSEKGRLLETGEHTELLKQFFRKTDYSHSLNVANIMAVTLVIGLAFVIVVAALLSYHCNNDKRQSQKQFII